MPTLSDFCYNQQKHNKINEQKKLKTHTKVVDLKEHLCPKLRRDFLIYRLDFF